MYSSFVNSDDLIDILAPGSYSPGILEAVRATKGCPPLGPMLARVPKLGITGTIENAYVSEKHPEAVPYITTKQIDGPTVYPIDCKFIRKQADEVWAKCRIIEGDILICKSGKVGSAGLLRTLGYSHCNSVSDVINIRLREDSELDPYYLVLFLNSRWGQAQLQQQSGGAIFDHVSIYAIPEIRVKVYELNVLSAIGNKVRKAERLQELADAALTEAFNSLDQAMGFVPMKSHGRSAWAQSRDFGVSRFDAEYYQPHYLHMDRHLEAWRASRKPISTLRSLMKSGSYGVLPSSDDYGQGDLRFLRAQDVGAFLIEDKEEVLVPRHYANPKAMSREGDLLLEVKGEIAGGAICPKAFEGCLVNGSLYRMTLKEDVDAFYVLALLLSPIGVLQKKRAAANSVISYLSVDFLYDLLIPRLSSEEESNIGQLIRSYTERVYQARSAIQQAKADVEALISNTLDIDALHAESAAIESWLAANPSQFASAN
jgi:type I restriction enzyme S subunit